MPRPSEKKHRRKHRSNTKPLASFPSRTDQEEPGSRQHHNLLDLSAEPYHFTLDFQVPKDSTENKFSLLDQLEPDESRGSRTNSPSRREDTRSKESKNQIQTEAVHGEAGPIVQEGSHEGQAGSCRRSYEAAQQGLDKVVAQPKGVALASLFGWPAVSLDPDAGDPSGQSYGFTFGPDKNAFASFRTLAVDPQQKPSKALKSNSPKNNFASASARSSSTTVHDHDIFQSSSPIEVKAPSTHSSAPFATTQPAQPTTSTFEMSPLMCAPEPVGESPAPGSYGPNGTPAREVNSIFNGPFGISIFGPYSNYYANQPGYYANSVEHYFMPAEHELALYRTGLSSLEFEGSTTLPPPNATICQAWQNGVGGPSAYDRLPQRPPPIAHASRHTSFFHQDYCDSSECRLFPRDKYGHIQGRCTNMAPRPKATYYGSDNLPGLGAEIAEMNPSAPSLRSVPREHQSQGSGHRCRRLWQTRGLEIDSGNHAGDHEDPANQVPEMLAESPAGNHEDTSAREAPSTPVQTTGDELGHVVGDGEVPTNEPCDNHSANVVGDQELTVDAEIGNDWVQVGDSPEDGVASLSDPVGDDPEDGGVSLSSSWEHEV
ncbi:hypothetical protein IWZ00DRAFT_506770 [Phyllosticta capitalensis]